MTNMSRASWAASASKVVTTNERAVEHGLRGLLVGHLIDEHVARILCGVRVEGRHDDSVLPSFLEDRRDRVEIDCRKRDRVGLLGQEILERLDLKRDVGVVGARVDEGIAKLGRRILAAAGGGFEVGEAGPLRRHHDFEA